MDAVHVGLVSRDAAVRTEMARAFDAAPAHWAVTMHDEPPDADVLVFGPDVDPARGIAFDPAHPERVVDAIRGLLQTPAVVTVTSTGGGTGVTSVALHLAAAAARSRPTCLVDLDPEWGVEWRLGLEGSSRWTPDRSVEDAAVPVAGGFKLLVPDASDPVEMAGPLLEAAADAFAAVIVDAPRRGHLETPLARSGAGVLVMQATVPGAKRAAAFMDRHGEGRWAIVANRLGGGGETTLAGLRRLSGLAIALELPCTPILRDAEDRGRLLGSRLTRWSRRIDALARALELA